MDDTMFRKRGVPLLFRLWLWFDEAKDWAEENWERVTAWALAVVGTGLLSVMFIV